MKEKKRIGEAAGFAYTFGYLGFFVRSRAPVPTSTFHVLPPRRAAGSDANLSDKTADGPLANPLEGKTAPRVRRGTERDGEGTESGGKGETENGKGGYAEEVKRADDKGVGGATGEISGRAIDWRADDADAQPTSGVG